MAAATLAQRYISDRFFPDKAIDLIDEALSQVRIAIDSKPEALDRLERRLIQFKIEREALKKESDSASQQRLVDLETQIDSKHIIRFGICSSSRSLHRGYQTKIFVFFYLET